MTKQILEKLERTRKIVTALYYAYFGSAIIVLIIFAQILYDLSKYIANVQALYGFGVITAEQYTTASLSFAAVALSLIAYALVAFIYIPVISSIIERWFEEAQEQLESIKEND